MIHQMDKINSQKCKSLEITQSPSVTEYHCNDRLLHDGLFEDRSVSTGEKRSMVKPVT